MKQRKVILASASPRRREILEQAGLEFQIVPSDKEEIVTKTRPYEMVEELSNLKAMDIVEKLDLKGLTQQEEIVIVGADTLVALDNTALGKPRDTKHAIQMLMDLQGKTHQVHTGVTIYMTYQDNVLVKTFHESTQVTVYPMTKEEVVAYVDTLEPMDKAGAYGIQGKFVMYIKEIQGEYNTVVGFPIARFMHELQSMEEEMEQL